MPTTKKRTAHRSKLDPGRVSFPGVGIGASAGGFEAFGEMLADRKRPCEYCGATLKSSVLGVQGAEYAAFRALK